MIVIRNFSRFEGEPGFAGSPVGFGGATEPSAMQGLKDGGFASVLNLRLESEEGAQVEDARAAAEAAGLQYIHLPYDPRVASPTIIDDFIAAVGDEANQPVYIHCRSANRVGVLWMVARVLKDGWSVEQAREEALQVGLSGEQAEGIASKYIEVLAK